jgi:WD40 repeat protein
VDDQSQNSLLAVGYKHNRSFVVRGNRIGVFRHTDDEALEFATTINNIGTQNGDFFSPQKVQLHNQDSTLLLMNPKDQHTIHVMDLEYGKVVDEWKVDDHKTVQDFAPEKKYAQQTSSQMLIGFNSSAVFGIDGRVSGNKLVTDMSKQYSKKLDFSAAATTGSGDLAIGSSKGNIRLYDKIGKAAKTELPGMGDPIIGMDTTENGKVRKKLI